MVTRIEGGQSLPGLGRAFLSITENLFPGYFALVMATGVVSIVSYQVGSGGLAWALVGVNWFAYGVLCLLTLVRLARFPRRMWDDLFDHQRGPGFLTLVAGTCVLGTQTAVVTGATALASGLWYAGLCLWVVVIYSFFTAVTIRESKPTFAKGINGAWLIAAVATQSIVVLRATIAPETAPSLPTQFLCLAMFLVGCMLYLAIIPMILYRLAFVRLGIHDFTPLYWINMGAVAITALAGATLILRAEQWLLLAEFVQFLEGFTLFVWAAATWWIPLLVALMIWRYVVRRDRPAYDPQLWGMVFPIAMYTTGTYQLSRALHLPFLAALSRILAFVAIAAWGVTAAWLVAYLVRCTFRLGFRPE